MHLPATNSLRQLIELIKSSQPQKIYEIKQLFFTANHKEWEKYLYYNLLLFYGDEKMVETAEMALKGYIPTKEATIESFDAGIVQYLSLDQVAALTPEFLAGLTAEQLSKLTAEQLSKLTAEQLLNALKLKIPKDKLKEMIDND